MRIPSDRLPVILLMAIAFFAFSTHIFAAQYTYTYSPSSDRMVDGRFRFDDTFQIEITFEGETNVNGGILLGFGYWEENVVSLHAQMGNVIQYCINCEVVDPCCRDQYLGKQNGAFLYAPDQGFAQFPSWPKNNFTLGNRLNGFVGTDESGNIDRWNLEFEFRDRFGNFGIARTSSQTYDSDLSAYQDVPLYESFRGCDAALESCGTIASTSPGSWGLQKEQQSIEHIIVLAHGWSPDSDLNEGSYMSQFFRQPILDRLTEAGIDLDTVAIVDEAWPSAFTPDRSGFNFEARNADYNFAYDGAPLGAQITVERVNEIIAANGSDADHPTIHIVGHSLGTVVAANAVRQLSSDGIHVDRVTLLDTPKNASKQVVEEFGFPRTEQATRKLAVLAADDALLFWELMPEGSVDYVENYYAGIRDYEVGLEVVRQAIGIPGGRPEFELLHAIVEAHRIIDENETVPGPRFGQPIAGAGPCSAIDGCSGYRFASADHGEVRNEYAALIGQTKSFENSDGLPIEWRTPALQSGNSSSLQDKKWNPTEDIIGYYDRLFGSASMIDQELDLAVEQAQSELPTFDGSSTGTSTIIDGWQRDFGVSEVSEETRGVILRSIDLIANSPTAISARLQADDLLAIEFDLFLDQAATGTFSVLFDEQILYELETGGSPGDVVVSIPTLLLFGEGRIQWKYDSNDQGSRATISDLRLLRVVPIPEPSSAIISFVLAACFFTLRSEEK